MLKKVGLVAVTTIALSLAATPAMADPTPGDDFDSYGDAAELFVQGGSDLGAGASAMFAAFFAGIVTLPALALDSLDNLHGDN